jgi:hypothetical protein
MSRFRVRDRLTALAPRNDERGSGDTYTDAVVTPPSMTMVWPVMKVEESEPR